MTKHQGEQMNENDSVAQEESTTTPRIYVASLADYNAGRLHGRWIRADQPAEALHQEIAGMLAESQELVAEDWAIHDYENFGRLHLSEFEDVNRVAEVAQLMGEHGEVFTELVGHFGGSRSVEEARRYMEEGYRGDFHRLAEYAEQLLDDCYGDLLKSLPDFIRYHIDYEGIADDMELNGDVFTIECNGRIHVFDTHL
jgi:antirestriction protein